MSRRFFALSEVTARIGALLSPAFGRTFWLRAEIGSARERGHFYCDLVETDAAGDVTAQMRCTIFARELARIRSAFKAAGLDLVLETGTLVGIECELRWDPRYGLSLVGCDMDPAFALGELELRRRRILVSLEQDGLFGRNARLAVPLLPTRIALVTSPGSAAYNDVVRTLAASPYGFRVVLAGATMQGNDTQRSVLEALDACARLEVDLVVVARGGGSKTDLAWLDDEAVARRIADFPVPVWTGIGHEIDVGVLDHVAAQAFKTPTAAAEAIVDRFDRVAHRLDEARVRLRGVWQLRRDGERERLRRGRTGLRQGSRKLLEQSRSDLLHAAERVRGRVEARLGRERAWLAQARTALRSRARSAVREREAALVEATRRLARGGRARLRLARERWLAQRARLSLRRVRRRIDEARERLAAGERLLRAADPRTALRRGFSLTTTADGRLVRSVGQVGAGETVVTRVADGRIESVVRGTEEERDG